MKKLSLLLIVLGLGCFLGCSEPVGPPEPQPDITDTQKTLVAASNNFGFKLYREIVNCAADTNIFISPLSVSMALGMTYNGARGTTREAMAEVLELSGLTTEEANQAYRSLIDLLAELDPEVAFQIANSIWYRQGFTVKQDFLDANQTFFDAEVAALDFNSPEAVNTINNWVEEKTAGKIPTVINSINPLTMMYLINAIYFQGDWTYRFAEDGTHEADFFGPGGAPVPCNMMSLEDTTLPYLETDLFQAVELPYGNGDYCMMVFLPHPQVALSEVTEQLTAENWARWQEQLVATAGDVYLPRFTLEYDLTLNDVLTALGMGMAFLPYDADFTGINEQMDLYLSSVLHKTFVEVNETGTEAAAVTVVTVGTTNIEDPPPGFVMRLERPFAFVIHDKHAGTLLFMGQITAPTEG